MAGHELGEEARIEIVAAAGPGADDENDLPAGIEGRGVIGTRRAARDEREGAERSQNEHSVGDMPFLYAATGSRLLLRPRMMTDAPSAASACAMARPMPRLEARTHGRLPAIPRSIHPIAVLLRPLALSRQPAPRRP